MYISDIIDNSLTKLNGEYTKNELLKHLAIHLASYNYKQSENFLSQSIYRLKREGVVLKKKNIYIFNSGEKWEPEEKTSLSKLVEDGLTADAKNTLLYKYKMIDQIPLKKSLIVQKRHGKIHKDLKGIEVGTTKFKFEKEESQLFEFAKLFELISNIEIDFEELYKVINTNAADIESTLLNVKEFISKKHILKYESFMEWLDSRVKRFDDK